MGRIKLITITKLKPHEEIIPENLEKIKHEIHKNGCLINPIIVDQKNLVILDGHHRVRALEILGYKKIPAYLVDYSDEEIKVFQRRVEIPVSKKIVVEKALSGEVFPCKTTKHLIPGRPMRLNISLKDLK